MPRKIEKSGDIIRQEKKKQHRLKVGKLTLELLDDHFFTLENVKTADKYSETIEKLEGEIEQAHKRRSDFIVAMKILQKRAKQIIDHHHLLASLPQVPDVQVMPRQRRNKDWFLRARCMYDYDAAFIKRVREYKGSNGDGVNRLLGLILYSLISNAGVLKADVLIQLFNLLQERDLTIVQYDYQPQIHIRLTVDRGYINEVQEDKYYRNHIVYLDPISFMLICEYMGKANYNIKIDLGVYGKSKRHIKYIKDSLFDNCLKDVHVNSLTKLMSAALWPKEARGSVIISEALLNMALGNYNNVDLCKSNHMNLYRKPLTDWSKNEVVLNIAETETLRKGFKGSAVGMNDFTLDLQKVFSKTKADNKHQSLAKLNAALIELKVKHSSISRSLMLLLDFYIYLSSSEYKTLKKTSALKTHHSNLSLVWINEFYDLDLESLSEEDFIEIYEEILNFKKTDQSRAATAKLLKRIHTFGMLSHQYTLPWLSDWAGLSDFAQVTNVNARILDHRYVKAASVYLNNTEYKDVSSEILYWIMMLSYRIGLRIGEIVKLQLKDINEGLLYIRSNKFGDTKSLSARRRVTYRKFFHIDEVAEFEKFLTARKNEKLGLGEALLFVTNSDQFITPAYASNCIGEALKNVTGDNVSFHNLRHSAANVFHLVIEKHWELAHQISGLEIESNLKFMRTVFSGTASMSRDAYYGLASYLGHASPVNTMSNYLHLAQLMTFKKLTKTVEPIIYDLLSSFTGLRKDSLQRSKTSEELCGRISKHYKPSFVKRIKADYSYDENAMVEWEHRSSKSFFSVYRVLKLLEQGCLPHIAADIFSIKLGQVKLWQANAVKLHNIVTREGVSRLFSAERKVRFTEGKANKVLLTPGVRYAKSELSDMEKMLSELRGKQGEGFTDQLRTVSWLLVNAATTTHSHLSYSKPDDLHRILTMFVGPIAKYRWNIQPYVVSGQVEKKRQLDLWKSILPKGMKLQRPILLKNRDRLNYPNGYVHIKIKHIDEKEIVNKSNNINTFSTNNLVNLAHMFLVMMGFPQQ